MPTPPTPPTYWWLTVRIDACRTRDERVAAASGDDAVRMWRELHPNVEVIHVRPVPELVDIELEHMSTNNNTTDPIRGVPPLLAARDALAEPVATPARPTDEEIIAFWSEHCAGDGDAGIIRLARWGNQPVPPAEGEAGELAAELRDLLTAEAAPPVPLEGEVGDPPPELVHRWEVDGQHHTYETPLSTYIATQAARWGAAQVVHRSAVPVADGPAVPEGREPASVVGKPSDKELLELMHRSMRDDLAEVSRLAALQTGTDPGVFRVCLNYDVARFARAVLARWGHQPAPPAAGEAGELASLIREAVRAWVAWEEGAVMLNNMTAVQLTRAADLLEQLSLGWVVPTVEQFAPVPVPVSERLPGDELCWWFEADEDCGYGSNWTLLRIRGCASGYTHWLPAHALPLPSEEVK